MTRARSFNAGIVRKAALALLAPAVVSCHAVLDLDAYRIEAGQPTAEVCEGGTACAAQLPSTSHDLACLDSAGCLQHVPASCPFVFGAARDVRSLHLGALLDLTGPEAAAGAVQARSIELAVAELNSAGGIRLRGEADKRPLTLVVCDINVGPRAAALTLVDSLGVSGLIGPPANDAFAEVAKSVALPHGMLLLAPGALDTTLAGEMDRGFLRQLVPSEQARVPMLVAHIQATAATLRARSQSATLKLAVVRRVGASQSSVNLALAELAQPAAAQALQSDLTLLEYTSRDDLTMLVASLGLLMPDLVVLDGAVDVVTGIIAPLELAAALGGTSPLPQYILTEAAQVPALSELLKSAPALQSRISLVSSVSSATAAPVHDRLERAYRDRYRAALPRVKAVAASYDAAYALAYALSAADDPLHASASVAAGLARLSEGAARFETGSGDIDAVLGTLSSRASLQLIGTQGELGWHEDGAVRDGGVGVVCLQKEAERWSFVPTGYWYNLRDASFVGRHTLCDDGIDVAAAPAATTPGQPPADMGMASAGRGAPSGAAGGAPAAPTTRDASMPAAAMSMSPALPDAGMPAPALAQDIGLSVQYRALNTDPSDMISAFALQITNREATTPVPLASLTLRYYLTNEHAELCPSGCAVEGFYAGIQPAGSAIPAKRDYVADATDPRSAYVEVSFPDSDIMLGIAERVEAQQQFHTEPYRPLDERDDYSFAPQLTMFINWERVTLHQAGKLVWGTPPAKH